MGPFGLSAGVARWVARVLVWLSLAAAIVLRFADPEPLPTFRNAFFDFAQRLLPPADDTPQAPLTIVEIAEPSLPRLGQWPWPRDLMADLGRELGRHEPRSIGLNILFPAHDTPSTAVVLQPFPLDATQRRRSAGPPPTPRPT